MSPRGHRILSGVSIVALLGLHLDFWNASRAEPFLLGWIPWDMAYHLAWMAAATAVVFHLTARVWTGRRPPGEAPRGGATSGGRDGARGDPA